MSKSVIERLVDARDDIREAINDKGGNASEHGFEDFANDIAGLSSLPIDSSSSYFEFGIDENGFYYTDEVGGGTPFSFGLDSIGLYVIGGNENA